MRKTFITQMPDHSGAFLEASKVITEEKGNIARVSYNKAVDVRMLFIDVTGTKKQIKKITTRLSTLGYLSKNRKEEKEKVILLEFHLKDEPGQVLPILELINEYNFNISYINSSDNGSDYQNFKMGLFIENFEMMKDFLEKASEITDVKIIDYDKSDRVLDNTIFYLSFANKVTNLLSLTQEENNTIIKNSNLIMQMLEDNGESPHKTFKYIFNFAKHLADHQGVNFKAQIEKIVLNNGYNLINIAPPCGSNTTIIQTKNKLLFVDGGFCCYQDEMLNILKTLFVNFSTMEKSLLITHPDVDHLGISPFCEKIYVSEESYQNFKLENENKANFRTQKIEHAPYYKISAILSGYKGISLKKLNIFSSPNKRKNKGIFEHLGVFDFEKMHFDIYQGNGGHSKGEILIIAEEEKIIFTGDIVVNIKGFSKEQKEFNKLAPYLMTSVNMDSKLAKIERNAIFKEIKTAEYLMICGHGKMMVGENFKK